jgi:hypothetical protein
MAQELGDGVLAVVAARGVRVAGTANFRKGEMAGG